MDNNIHQARGIMRKITVGQNYKDGMNYELHKTVAVINAKITQITMDEHDSEYFFLKRYNIYVEDNSNKEEYLWKSIENMPVIVEFLNPRNIDTIN